MAKPSLPGDAKEDGAEVFVLEKWGSLNTKASRTAIPDNDFSYDLNFFPVGDGNLRTIYAEGATIYGAPDGKTILYRYPFNLDAVRYIAVFLDDGTAVQVKVDDGSTVSISAAAGTFSDGVIIPACAQHGAENIIIVSTVSDNGYWIWDGSHLFGAGTLAFNVLIEDGGDNYTSTPTLTAYGGSGSGATFTVETANDVVTKATVNNPGAGYVLHDVVALAFSGGGSDDGAAALAVVNKAVSGVQSVQVIDAGKFYSTGAKVTFTGGGGAGAEAIITQFSTFDSGGVSILEITVTNSGSGYTSQPTISITNSSTGSGFVGVAVLKPGQITSITVAAAGSNFTTPPSVTITGDGSGASATAQLTGGTVSGITVNRPGIGYTRAVVTLSGGNKAARASIGIMPFGVAGDTVETYQQRVWVGDGNKALFTAPDSLSDFSASSGGGAYPVTDSFTRYKITKFIQNNFLYQINDSSVNVISNVQTAGAPATTSFNNENVDPQVGTDWPQTVVAFGRATMFANPTGVYALFGGAAQKVSDQLDGLFANASFNTGADGVTPSAAVFDLFSIKVYGILFTTIDPYSGQPANMIAVWNGTKWFLANQIKTLKAISTQEIDSKIVAWGDDGTNLFPLFQSPSSQLTKIAQTKLAQLNSYIWWKQVNRFYVLAQSNDGNIAEFQVGIDTERGAGVLTSADNVVGELQFLGADQAPLVFEGAGGQPIDWTVSNLVLYGYRSATYGRLIGTTVTTTATDATLISMTGLYRPHHAPYA